MSPLQYAIFTEVGLGVLAILIPLQIIFLILYTVKG